MKAAVGLGLLEYQSKLLLTLGRRLSVLGTERVNVGRGKNPVTSCSCVSFLLIPSYYHPTHIHTHACAGTNTYKHKHDLKSGVAWLSPLRATHHLKHTQTHNDAQTHASVHFKSHIQIHTCYFDNYLCE